MQSGLDKISPHSTLPPSSQAIHRPAAAQVASIVAEIAASLGLKKRGNKYVGQCPDCGGKKGSDKFNFRDDGGFKCYACDLKGDIITWLRTRSGMSCPDAHDSIGRPCRSASFCAVRATCRLGDGSGERLPAVRQRRSITTRPGQAVHSIATADDVQPSPAWQAWAEAMIAKAAVRLTTNYAVLAYLATRGIDFAAAIAAGLGWRDHDQHIDRSAMGFTGADPDSGKFTQWVPGGLVIPVRDIAEIIRRVIIRRTTEARNKFLPDLKYYFVKGGKDYPLYITPQLSPRGAVIVEADLDAIAVAAAHPDVAVVALRTVKGGITAGQRQRLATMPSILVALDADGGKEGAMGAGPQAVAAWTETFRQARFWPPPAGKDAGEYAEQGGNVNAWIEAGLPPVLRPAKNQDAAFIPGSIPQGEEGMEDCKGKQAENGDEPPTVKPVKHYTMELPGGRVVHITDDKATWLRLVDSGEIAFSEHELQRLLAACKSMDAVQRQLMVEAAILTKETLPAAYIRAGREISEGEGMK